MLDNLVCWKCGASLAELSLPFSRTDECRVPRVNLGESDSHRKRPVWAV